MLDDRGFGPEGLTRLLGFEPAPGTFAEIAVAVRRLPGGDPLATLARLFVLETGVDGAAAAAAFAPLSVSDVARLGLVEQRGDRVEPLVRLGPSGPLLLVSDLR